MRILLLLIVLVFSLTVRSIAHPVAQGAMSILISETAVQITARVSTEEAFVQTTHSRAAEPPKDLPETWQRHGEYLLQHVRVYGDGAPLMGKLLRVTEPESSSPTTRITYELEYAMPAGGARPAVVSFKQDVLNEFEFVPGNRWEATYVVRIAQEGRTASDGLLFTSGEPLVFDCDWSVADGIPSAPQMDRRALFGAYFNHGVMHILTGYDHLLFMAALVLAAATLWDLVKVVTAFSVAHTITLALSVFDVVRLPSHIVEPVIAGSIVFVAVQNVFWPERTRGWGRLLVAFGFGLFHGLGFAGGLLEAMEGLPGAAIVLAIAAFSLGVEIGHQAVVLPVFGCVHLARAAAASPPTRERLVLGLRRWGSGAIMAAGLFYFALALR
jgi:hydrogenase/urease accessory protein HupE